MTQNSGLFPNNPDASLLEMFRTQTNSNQSLVEAMYRMIIQKEAGVRKAKLVTCDNFSWKVLTKL